MLHLCTLHPCTLPQDTAAIAGRLRILEDLRAALGIAQVKASRVAVGPQPYSLAVIGAFTGVLASAANPVNGNAASSSNGTCQIVVAVISEGPTGLTNLT